MNGMHGRFSVEGSDHCRLLNRSAQPRQVVIAVADRVILEHELTGQFCVSVEGHRDSTIERLVRKRADCRCGFAK